MWESLEQDVGEGVPEITKYVPTETAADSGVSRDVQFNIAGSISRIKGLDLASVLDIDKQSKSRSATQRKSQ